MHESRNNNRENEQLLLSWWLFALQSIIDVLQKCCFTRSSNSDWSGTSCTELKQFSRVKFHENNWQLNGPILDLNLSTHSMIMCFHYTHHLKELQPQQHCFLSSTFILEAFQVTQSKIKSLQNIFWGKMSWMLDYVQEPGKKKHRYFTCNLKLF